MENNCLSTYPWLRPEFNFQETQNNLRYLPKALAVIPERETSSSAQTHHERMVETRRSAGYSCLGTNHHQNPSEIRTIAYYGKLETRDVDNSEVGCEGDESFNQQVYFRFFAGRSPAVFFDGLKPTYFPSGLGNFSLMKLTVIK
jgi:hypothetical protein